MTQYLPDETTVHDMLGAAWLTIAFFLFLFHTHIYFPASGQQAVVTGVVPSCPPRFLPSIFIAHGVQQSHCSSIFHRVLLTHALALSASQLVRIVRKKWSPRMYTSMHSGGFQLTKLTYTRLEDNLIRHGGRRIPHCRSDCTRYAWRSAANYRIAGSCREIEIIVQQA